MDTLLKSVHKLVRLNMVSQISDNNDFPIFVDPGEVDLNLPVPLGDREYCGNLDIKIGRDGTWYYNSKPIERKELACLLSNMLALSADGRYWLVSPTEMGRISVADAPFIAVEMTASGKGKKQEISLLTSTEQKVTISSKSPFYLKPNPAIQNLAPYVKMENNMEVLIRNDIFLQLHELSVETVSSDNPVRGFWSAGAFFPIGNATPHG
ncbi:MAG: DUF1285 domain-containing protein [Rhodospirillaceae bacterium]|nr:DUF1285 domain-containing protein [Rhodospirillaceae bacterium]